MHAANLLKGLNKYDSDADVEAWGGERLEAEGARIKMHYRNLAFMGFVEVVANLPKIFKNFRICKEQILRYQPDVIITVDYPGFNMRMHKWAAGKGIPVIHYISPNVWAWKSNRVHTLNKNTNHLFVILPFETEFYGKYDIHVEYEGHPLLDEIDAYRHKSFEAFTRENGLDARPKIALLAGSRRQEIQRMLPLMLDTAKRHRNYEFLVAAPGFMDESFYRPYLEQAENVRLVSGKTYEVLQHSEAALVTSGTATLEAALFNLPQVVCYKSSAFSFTIARMLAKVRRISLVNLIMKKDVVTELIQHLLNAESLNNEFVRILPGGDKRQQILDDYNSLFKMLGEKGVSDRVAKRMYEFVRK